MRRIKHATTALPTPSVPYTAWNAWLMDEDGAVIDLTSYFRLADAGITSVGLQNWGILQLWNTGSPAPNYNCGAQYVSTLVNWATDSANDAEGIRAEAVVQTGVPAGGYPTSMLYGVMGTASNYGANSELYKMMGGSFDARVYGKAISEVYGLMAQASHMSYQTGTVIGRVTGLYADSYTSDLAGGIALAVTTIYGIELRAFGKTNTAGSTSTVGTAYGLYSSLYCQQAAGSTSTITDAYNIYVTGRKNGGLGVGPSYGPITNYYHIYLDDLGDVNSSNKWAIYSAGGDSYFVGKLMSVAGLGVGNSAAATTLGNVAKKMQVFDSAGASLGYVPIYDAIT